MDLNLKEIIGPKKEDKISVSLFDDYKKIKTTVIEIYGIIQI